MSSFEMKRDITDETKATEQDSNVSDEEIDAIESVYDIKNVLDWNGEKVDLEKFKGKVLIISNFAIGCGFTDPNLACLRTLQDEYKDLEILLFPCNQFAGQHPYTKDEYEKIIRSGEMPHCYMSNPGTDPKDLKNNWDKMQPLAKSFLDEGRVYSPVDVNGKNACDLWRYMRHMQKGYLGSSTIKWNFSKFIVDKNGQVIRRYAPQFADAKLFEEDVNILLDAHLENGKYQYNNNKFFGSKSKVARRASMNTDEFNKELTNKSDEDKNILEKLVGNQNVHPSYFADQSKDEVNMMNMQYGGQGHYDKEHHDGELGEGGLLNIIGAVKGTIIPDAVFEKVEWDESHKKNKAEVAV